MKLVLITTWMESVNLMDAIKAGDGIQRSDSSITLLFSTQLTFDLIMSPRDISILGIHPYCVYYTYINIISIDASFYSLFTQFCHQK